MEAETTAQMLLGLGGLVVLKAMEDEGEIFLLVETQATDVACPRCGTRAKSKRRTTIAVRDVPTGGRPVRLLWRKRRWRCGEADCEAKTWTEELDGIARRSCLSERARADICSRVGRDAASVALLAREYGISWSTAMGAVVTVGTPLVDDPGRTDGVHCLGMDETSFLAGNGAHPTTYVTGESTSRRRCHRR